MPENIRTKIDRFYSLISNYTEGGPDTRYKSWEWCHYKFLSLKDEYNNSNNKVKKELLDLLSLHLAFYLASWGMYRGSSYLLQRDYKAHKKAIKEILKPQYNLLWNYKPNNKNVDTANNLLFNRENGIYWKVKRSYPNYKKGKDDEPSDTLITKILLGTFGCIPAFDRYLKAGIGNYKNVNKIASIGHYKLTQSIENKNGATESFKALAKFAIDNRQSLKINKYPLMKCVDMYFWEIGYELDLSSGLVNSKDDKKKEIKKRAVQLKLCNIDDTFDVASAIIKSKNS